MKGHSLRNSMAAFLLIMTLIFSACGAKPERNSDIIRVSGFDSIYHDGMLYTDQNGALKFLDFDTLGSIYVCSKPNCTHRPSESKCSAYGMSLYPFIYGDHIYFFEDYTYHDDEGKIECGISLNRAEKDGTGRVMIVTIDNRALYSFGDFFIKDNILYFPAESYTYDDIDGGQGLQRTNHSKMYLYSIDLITNKASELSLITEGWNVRFTFHGIWDSKIYYDAEFFDEEIILDFGQVLPEDFPEPNINRRVLDIDTLENTENEKPGPQAVMGQYYFYNRQKETNEYELIMLDLDNGSEKVILDGFSCSRLAYLDNKIFMYKAGDFNEDNQPIFGPNREEYYYDLVKDTSVKLDKKIPSSITFFLLSEYEDKFIFSLTDMNDTDIGGSMGAILKDDFYSGMKNYIFTEEDFSNAARGN